MLLRWPSLSRETRDGLGIGIMHAQGQLAWILGSWGARCCAEKNWHTRGPRNVLPTLVIILSSRQIGTSTVPEWNPQPRIIPLASRRPANAMDCSNCHQLEASQSAVSVTCHRRATAEECVHQQYVDYLQDSGRWTCATNNNPGVIRGP